MKKTVGLVAVVATLAAMALTVAPVATAQPQGLPIAGATCTDLTTSDPVGCALTLVGFRPAGGALNAVFRFTNLDTGAVTQVLVPVTSILPPVPPGSCTILDLTIGPIDLDLLGLNLVTNEIRLRLTAQRGTLLGDLLCGLFFGSPNLGGILTSSLGQGLITQR